MSETTCIDDRCPVCGEYESECECAALVTPEPGGEGEVLSWEDRMKRGPVPVEPVVAEPTPAASEDMRVRQALAGKLVANGCDRDEEFCQEVLDDPAEWCIPCLASALLRTPSGEGETSAEEIDNLWRLAGVADAYLHGQASRDDLSHATVRVFDPQAAARLRGEGGGE